MGDLTPAECHGRHTFADRPPAGTDPWDWWWEVFAPQQVVIYVGDTGDDWAWTQWSAAGPFVTFHYNLTASQRSTSIAHEMHHLAIGGVCRSLCARNEKLVRRETARWLLPDIEYVAHLLRRQAAGAAALKLGVDRDVLHHRIDTATPTERNIVAAILGQGPRWVPEARAAQKVVAIAR